MKANVRKASLGNPPKMKDNASPKYTEQAGTKSSGGKYTCRNERANGKFSVKPMG